jgi:hypothetical protein
MRLVGTIRALGLGTCESDFSVWCEPDQTEALSEFVEALAVLLCLKIEELLEVGR